MFVPLSIPSPSYDFQVLLRIPVGQWLQGIGLPADTTINIYSYAICILIGMLAAALLTHIRLTRRGGEPGIVLDVAIWAVIFGIIGARVYHVLTHPDDYFFAGADPFAVVRIWDGGIAIFGSLIGGAIGILIGCRLTGLRFWSFADALVPGLLLAQAIGRLGNWFNHELFGLPTDLPWGLEIEASNPAFPAGLPDGTLFHPTFLYEIIWNLVGVVLLLLAERRFTRGTADIAGVRVSRLEPVSYRLQWGRLTGLYLVWYGTGRMIFESIRLDPSELFLGVRTNVWGAFIAIVLGLIIIIVQGRRHPGREPSVYVPGREWTRDAGIESGDTYSDDDDLVAVPSAPNTAATSATSGIGAKA